MGVIVGLILGLLLKGILLKLMLSHHISRIHTYYLLTDYNDCIKLETFNLTQTVATNYRNVNIMMDAITETIVHQHKRIICKVTSSPFFKGLIFEFWHFQ